MGLFAGLTGVYGKDRKEMKFAAGPAHDGRGEVSGSSLRHGTDGFAPAGFETGAAGETIYLDA